MLVGPDKRPSDKLIEKIFWVIDTNDDGYLEYSEVYTISEIVQEYLNE